LPPAMADKEELRARLQRARHYSSLVREMFKPAPVDASAGPPAPASNSAVPRSRVKEGNQRPRMGKEKIKKVATANNSIPPRNERAQAGKGSAGAPSHHGALSSQGQHKLAEQAGDRPSTDEENVFSTSHLPYTSPPLQLELRRKKKPRTAAEARRSLPTSRRLDYLDNCLQAGRTLSQDHGFRRRRGEKEPLAAQKPTPDEPSLSFALSSNHQSPVEQGTKGKASALGIATTPLALSSSEHGYLGDTASLLEATWMIAGQATQLMEEIDEQWSEACRQADNAIRAAQKHALRAT
jgi:hypothetical protein